MDILKSGRDTVARAPLLLTNTCMTEFEQNGVLPYWDSPVLFFETFREGARTQGQGFLKYRN